MKPNDSLELFHSGPVWRAVFKNAVPAMAGMLMTLIYNLADTFFVGLTQDAFQVAAVSLATPAFLLFLSFANIFAIGGTSVISRALGEQNLPFARKVCAFCMWIGVATGVVVAAAFLLFMDPILQLLGASPDTWSHAKSYLSVASLSGPFVIISNCYANVLRTEGQSARAMMGALLGNVVNIVLDPILILTLGWGTLGAAVATVIGNLVAALYYILYFLKGTSMLTISLRQVTLRHRVCSSVLAIGIPASLSSMLMSLSQILQNSYMTQYGDMAVAGLGIAGKVVMITSITCLGLSQGVQPILGYCVGARLWPRFKAVLRFSLLMALVLGGVLSAACVIFAPQLVRAFLTQPEAFSCGVQFVRIYMLTAVTTGLFFVLLGALQAMGATRPSLVTNICRRGLIFVPIMLLLHHVFGMIGLVWAQPLADVLSMSVAAAACLVAIRNRARA